MEEINIRRANQTDVESIFSIIQHAFLRYSLDAEVTEENVDALNESVEVISRDIDEKQVFVSEFQGEPIGTLRVEIQNKGKWAYLSRFGVNPDYASLGVGNKMLTELASYLLQEGITQIRLHTASKASNTIRFYYSNNFYVAGVDNKKGYLRVMMIRDLESEENVNLDSWDR
ncbi:MAG: GNAT family N-acetyltransferase [Clostridiales bacterium]|jgi:ribosomal protein S18 acetylase RimI-like enzyme|nr:GNAT family N-acetyltransferase [Clostridiales bacterium]